MQYGVQIYYHQQDISRYLDDGLLAFSWADKAEGEADELSLTIADPTGKWAGAWFPRQGDELSANIIPVSTSRQKLANLPIGRYWIDKVKVSGKPRTIEIGAVSVPFDASTRRLKKNAAFEKVTLRDIATRYAGLANATLLWDSKTNPYYERIEQKRESDLAFIARLCKEAELSLKIVGTQWAIFDRAAYDKKNAVATIEIVANSQQLGAPGDALSYSFETQLSDAYDEVLVDYTDPKTGRRYTASARENTGEGDTSQNELKDKVGKIANDWEGHPFNPGQQAQCAQFVRAVFEEAGIKLPSAANPSDHHLIPDSPVGPGYADSFAGPEVGTKIDPASKLQPGDIVMWANTYGNWPVGTITHVGVVGADGKIIHRPTARRPVEHIDQSNMPWPIAEVRRPYWTELAKAQGLPTSKRKHKQQAQRGKIVKRVTSKQEAERIAKAELRKRNLRQVTGNLVVIGDFRLVSGINILVKGAGAFDGKFAVEEATHKLMPYTTELKIRRIEEW